MKTPESIYYLPENAEHTFDISGLKRAENLLTDEKILFQRAANLAACDRGRVEDGEPPIHIPGTLNPQAEVYNPKTGEVIKYDVNKFNPHAVVLDPKTGIASVAPGPDVTYRQWGADDKKITAELLHVSPGKVEPGKKFLVTSSPIPNVPNRKTG